MEPTPDPGILHTLIVLAKTLGTLTMQLAGLGLHWLLWILWAAWWLGGVNAKKMRYVLASGGWAPAVLLIVVVAIVWSRIDPSPCPSCGLPTFWWQLGYVSLLAGSALFFGWLQCVFHWTPHDINLDPPTHSHGPGHGHGHGHEQH